MKSILNLTKTQYDLIYDCLIDGAIKLKKDDGKSYKELVEIMSKFDFDTMCKSNHVKKVTK